MTQAFLRSEASVSLREVGDRMTRGYLVSRRRIGAISSWVAEKPVGVG